MIVIENDIAYVRFDMQTANVPSVFSIPLEHYLALVFSTKTEPELRAALYTSEHGRVARLPPINCENTHYAVEDGARCPRCARICRRDRPVLERKSETTKK
jgi:hypothetical protein